MPPLTERIQCEDCSRLASTNSHQCSHCLVSFCYQCLIKHHHNDVESEFMDMINQIDKILNRFLHHAHSQTEWTNHLTEDRSRLKSYIQYMQNCYKYCPIFGLPNSQWINHVNNLIRKDSNAIYENCCTLNNMSVNSFIKL